MRVPPLLQLAGSMPECPLELQKTMKNTLKYDKRKCLDFSDLDKKVENVPLAPRANSSRVGFINDSC